MLSNTRRIVGKDGYVYIGGVNEHGERHGFGCITDKSGFQRFAGNFVRDIPSGQCGQCIYLNNTVFAGSLNGGRREGTGRLHRLGMETVFGPVIYDGSWENDVPDGLGIFSATDGVYEGEWRRGRRHGKGRFLYKLSGRELPVLQPGSGWLAVLAQVETAAEEIAETTRLYEGDWENDQPHGVGRYCGYTLKFERGRIVQESIESYGHDHHSGKRLKERMKSSGHKLKQKLSAPAGGCMGDRDQAIDVIAVMKAGAPSNSNSCIGNDGGNKPKKLKTPSTTRKALSQLPDATVVSAPFLSHDEKDCPWNRALFRK